MIPEANIWNKAITKREVLNGCGEETSRKISKHVAFGVDAHYVRPLGVSITSLLENNSDENLTFHIFVNSINADDVQRLRELVKQYETTIILYYIDITVFEQLPTTWQYSHAIYNRFIPGTILHGITDKVLYLDADIVCIGRIAELFAIEMEDNIVAVAHDAKNEFVRKLNLRHGKYFNAGVIYINVNKWHEQNISGKAIQLLVDNYERFNLFDQDALNVVLDGKAKFISNKWNCICNLEKNCPKIPSDTIFVHFVARSKPWHRWCFHPLVAVFHAYASKSLWRDIPLDDKPRSYKEMKMLGRVFIYEKHFLRAMYWYFKYLQEKTKMKFMKKN